jgi:hypothetical protein
VHCFALEPKKEGETTMFQKQEPNPPARREEDFPKTTTIPDGWVTDALMEAYNGQAAVPQRDTRPLPQQEISVPATGGTNGKTNGHTNGRARHASEPGEENAPDLFTRRLDPFPSPGDSFGMWL